MTDSPEKADVIFDFRDSPVQITVLKPSSRVTLWTVSDPLNGAYPESSQKRASLQIENIVCSLKEIVGVPLTAAPGSGETITTAWPGCNALPAQSA